MPGVGADAAAALMRLEQIVRGYGPTLTAFSGGVDSTLVACVAARAHGERALAVTGVSPSLAGAERAHAARVAAELGLAHREVETHELARPEYRANAGDRCYHCKTELFERLHELAAREGLGVVASGENLDDLDDVRPGRRAAAEHGVRAPLVEAGLNKAAVRSVAALLGLPNADKPASPCLASRLPVGTAVDALVLEQIERAEASVRALGFRSFRVRHHGDVARLEVAAEELPGAFACRVELDRVLRAAGYRFVALDLTGFRSGSLAVLDGARR
jgi:uncharacterized protein